MGAERCLAAELRSALADDLLDDRNGLAIFVSAEQPPEQVGVRIRAHDVIVDSNAISRCCDHRGSACDKLTNPSSRRGGTGQIVVASGSVSEID